MGLKAFLMYDIGLQRLSYAIKRKKFIFNKLFSLKEHNRQEVVTAFSGLLELSRRSKVETKQEELFRRY